MKENFVFSFRNSLEIRVAELVGDHEVKRPHSSSEEKGTPGGNTSDVSHETHLMKTLMPGSTSARR